MCMHQDAMRQWDGVDWGDEIRARFFGTSDKLSVCLRPNFS